MKRILTSTLVLFALLVAAPARAQTALPPGSLNQSKNSLITKFIKLGFAFGKSYAVGNGFGYDGVSAATQNRINLVTVKTGIAYIKMDVAGVVGAAADAPENHLADLQKAIKTMLPNWKDGAAWVQAAHTIAVADANAGVDTAQKEAVEQVETPLLYVTFENVLQKESNTVSYRLSVFNVAQVATLESPAAEPVVAVVAAAPLPTPVPVAPVAFVAQPAPVAEPAPAQAAAGCDPSYPTICIPASSPDLDCPDVAASNFQVLPPDPHRFDRDHDGLGCES